MAKASASATTANMAHGCTPQWKMAEATASRCAASGSAPSTPNGGSRKWSTGSATPKNISPMPMPAANNIANHDQAE